MPDVEVRRLRALRDRAKLLLGTIAKDLDPFKHKSSESGFKRKPDSPVDDPTDVNVTTTCSCLMALAQTDKLREVYGTQYPNIVGTIFGKVVEAPWMSSGLGENNAFTSVLVMRLLGFLIETETSIGEAVRTLKKAWEPSLDIADFQSIAAILTNRSDAFATALYDRLPADLQRDIVAHQADPDHVPQPKARLERELLRIVRSGPLSELATRQEGELKANAEALIKDMRGEYKVARVNRLLLQQAFGSSITPLVPRSFEEIAAALSDKQSNFGINDYEPAAALIYWFVDGVDRAELTLQDDSWSKLCKSAASDFARARSLVAANDVPRMDPVALGMAACLCSRLRHVGKKKGIKDLEGVLPSRVELESAVSEVFARQIGGIWPKYFPLFHYQEAGSNYCYAFELLEALLVEFGRDENDILSRETTIHCLEEALSFCESNRLQYSEAGLEYNGWNSGGDSKTLRKGQPESWATAVVHMFLWELVEVASRRIQRELLRSHRVRLATADGPSIEKLLDIELRLKSKPARLKVTLKETIVATFKDYSGRNADRLRRRGAPPSAGVSALLFGPPGTSKTEVAKAIANELGWPLVLIDPSDFLGTTFQNIYAEASRVFANLMDMSAVVVLFDEMDALVQKRDGSGSLDTEGKFLTTYMLPKLADLHDERQVVFLMATNFQHAFDDAIKRAGRFDLLLCMGPPLLSEKCEHIHTFYGERESTPQTQLAGKRIAEFTAADPLLHDMLTLYTYGEFRGLLRSLGNAESVGANLGSMKATDFATLVAEDYKSVGLQLRELDDLKRLAPEASLNRLSDYDTTDFANVPEEARKSSAVRYVLDRRASRNQT